MNTEPLPFVERIPEGRPRGARRDCVIRAISLAAELPYSQVYNELTECSCTLRDIAKVGVWDDIWKPYLKDRGWIWTPTMFVGKGAKVHLRKGELPDGRLIVKVSRHLTFVDRGIILDDHDPSRDGTRCVYGFLTKG